MENWVKEILEVGDKVNKVLPDNICFCIHTEEHENIFGGNPERKAVIEIKDIDNKETINKIIDWHMASMSEDTFINEVKAYCLDYLTR